MQQQELLLTHGLTPVVAAPLEEPQWMFSNEAFRLYTDRQSSAEEGIAKHREAVTTLDAQIADLQAQIVAKRKEHTRRMQYIANHQLEHSDAQRLLKELKPRLSFPRHLPGCVLLQILGRLGKTVARRAACVRQEWRVDVPAG